MSKEMLEMLEQLSKVSKTRSTGKMLMKNYTFQVGQLVKLPPQAVECIKIIANLGKSELTEMEIHTAIQESELKTKQDKWSIFKYYRKNIIEAGFLTEVK